MAIPTTITTLANPSVGGARPYISSGGNVYVLLRDSSPTTTLSMFKATDPTSSFASIGTDFAVSSGLTIQSIATTQVGDVIHVVTMDGTNKNDKDLRYHTFNMATDAWVITNETISETIVDTSPNGAINNPLGIAVRSDGDVIVLYQSDSVANMGSQRSRVSYARRESASWTIDVAVDDGGGTSWGGGTAVLGGSDRTHFFFDDLGLDDAYQRTLTSANALETFPSSFDSTSAGSVVTFARGGVAYDSGGTIKVRLGYVDGTASTLNSAKLDSADSPTVAVDSDITGTTNANTSAYKSDFAVDGTDLYCFFVEVNVNDISWIVNSDDGGWSSPTAFWDDASDLLTTYANVYTRGSSVVVGVVSNISGSVLYNEYLISTSGVSGDADFTFGAMTTTSDGDVSVGGTYNKTFVAMTTTSDGDVSLSGTANFTFGAMTTTSEVDVVVVADSDTTFDAMTLTAAGTVADPVIIGDADFTFGAMTTTSDGDVAVDADAIFTFGAMTTTADADVAVVADANFSYDTMAVSSTGDVSLSGTADFTFGAMTLTADGTAAFDERIGTADFTFGGMTTTADATTFKTRLYLTDVNNDQSGTYPTDSQATSPLIYDYAVSTATTLKRMTIEKGDSASQELISGASLATTNPQVGLYGMWASPPLAGNQTITNAALNINCAFAQSNLEMNLGAGFTAEIYVWRSSTGTKVGTIHHNVTYDGVEENGGGGSTRVDHGTALSSTEVSALDGDVIICEYFHHHTQDTAVSRNGFTAFDGSTVVIKTQTSVSAHASFIEFEPEYAFQGLAAVADANFTFGAMTTTSDGDVAVLADADFTFDAMTVTSDGDVAIIVVDGDFSFDAMTTTSDADVFVDADANFTLGAMTTTTEVDVLVDATADLTFGAMTLTTEVDVAVLGTADFTFGAMTLTADGTVSAAPVIVADADFTFGSMTTTTDVDILVEADADFSYAAMTATASGALAIAASATLLMGAMSTASDGDVFIVGESNFTYDAMTVSAAILGEAEMANLDKISLFASDYAPGTINDKLKKLLIANGATGTHIDDLWMSFLGNLGHTGSMNDRLRKFLLAYHAVSDTGQTVDDLWSLVTGPYTP